MKVWRVGIAISRLIIRVKFRWFDLWVGFYYDKKTGILHFCPVPTIAIEIQWLSK